MFSRLQDPFIEVNEAKIESLVVPQSLSIYLATVNYLPENPVFTEAFKMVADACRDKHTVGIQGGKGCGKIFILLVLFILCWSENKNWLYLTPISFHSNQTCRKYIKEFVQKNNYIDSVNKDKILKGSLSITEMIEQFLDDCTDKKSLLLFMDLCPRKPRF